ncbi:MAG TPA: hypothetical protein VHP37_06890 [Burkholderiales bacterium]|nr:hypothetical protein [Burkholderiales bacterium]
MNRAQRRAAENAPPDTRLAELEQRVRAMDAQLLTCSAEILALKQQLTSPAADLLMAQFEKIGVEIVARMAAGTPLPANADSWGKFIADTLDGARATPESR